MEAIDNDWDVSDGVIAQRPSVHGAMWNLSGVHDLIAETLSPRGQGWPGANKFTEDQ